MRHQSGPRQSCPLTGKSPHFAGQPRRAAFDPLRDRIVGGLYEPGVALIRRKGGPTITDVAAAAGVSVSTVSRVARGHVDVNAKTRELVLGTIHKLGYEPSQIARALVSGRTETVGLLVSDIANPFYPQLAKSIEREASRHGFTVIICNTEDDTGESERHVRRLVARGIDGIIHASVAEDERVILEQIGDTRRVVFTNRRPRSQLANYVVSDNERGAAELTKHLLDTGHTRIGFIGGPDYASNAMERLRGFRRVMDATPGSQALVVSGAFDPETGFHAAKEWLANDQHPTAIIGVNDSVAFGAMEAVFQAGLVIPDEIAIAGFDDIDLASSTIIGLTSVAQHIERLGQRSFEILLDRMAASDADKPLAQEVIPPTLHIRRTTQR